MSLKLLVCLIGSSGSGKTTLQNQLIASGRFNKVVSTTTRNIRVGEQNGREYNFVTPAAFADLRIAGKFIETVEFSGNSYGVTVNSVADTSTNSHVVLVVESQGLPLVLNHVEKNIPDLIPVIFHLYIPENIRRENMLRRGDSPEIVNHRLATDKTDQLFLESGIEATATITELSPDLIDSVLVEISHAIPFDSQFVPVAV